MLSGVTETRREAASKLTRRIKDKLLAFPRPVPCAFPGVFCNRNGCLGSLRIIWRGPVLTTGLVNLVIIFLY